MTFAVPAEAYDRFIGRYSEQLAPRFLDFAGVEAGPALDVGCGPGNLTRALAQRLGASSVAAVDVSAPFVAACRERVPGADVRLASAEQLPFADGAFAGVLAQLVLSFIPGAARAAGEMLRVLRPEGVAAACTFDANGFALARTFWDAALRFDPAAPDDARMPYRRTPELVALWEGAGFRQVRTAAIDLEAGYSSFDDFWSSFAAGIGPAASYLVAQPADRRQALRDACHELLGKPAGAFSLPARVLAVCGSR